MFFDLIFPTLPMGIVMDIDGDSGERGGKDAYTEKQQRQAEHIEEGYLEKGVGKDEAESRAWATVNAIHGGGKRSGSGRGRKVNKAPMRKGAKKAAAKRRTSPARSTSKSTKKTTARKGARSAKATTTRRSPRVPSSRRRTSRSRGTKRRS